MKYKGFEATEACPIIFAIGLRLYLFIISSDANSTAAAPSLKLLALAAVIEPFLSNTGFNLDMTGRENLYLNGSIHGISKELMKIKKNLKVEILVLYVVLVQ